MTARELWQREKNTQTHVFSSRRSGGDVLYGEALVFIIDGRRVFVACEEFLVGSPADHLLVRLSTSASPLRHQAIRLVKLVEETSSYYKRVIGRRPSIVEVDSPLLPSVLFPLDGVVYVTQIVNRVN